MNSDILLRPTAIFCLLNLYLNRVLARCTSWLISFAWDCSSCKERKWEFQNEKLLNTARFELTILGFWSYGRNRLAIRLDTLSTNKTLSRFFQYYLYLHHSTRQRFFLSCIQYCSHTTSASIYCIYIILVKQQYDTDVIWLQYWIHVKTFWHVLWCTYK